MWRIPVLNRERDICDPPYHTIILIRISDVNCKSEKSKSMDAYGANEMTRSGRDRVVGDRQVVFRRRTGMKAGVTFIEAYRTSQQK